MSEYAELYVKDYSLYWFRNYLDKNIVELFYSSNDLSIIKNFIDDPEDKDSTPYTKYEYKSTVKNAKERLDILGFGISRFERLFNERKYEVINYFPYLYQLDLDDTEDVVHKRIDKYVSFKKWMNSIRKFVRYKIYDKDDDSYKITTECDKIISYDDADEYSDSFWGLKTDVVNIGYIFRIILEFCDNDDEISLDFSNLEYWDEKSIKKAIECTGNNEKIVVLVEGRSDKDIIEFAMSMFYPKLSDLFYIVDFSDEHGNKRETGASFIRKQLKTFYFAKLHTRFIAVFDNDATGYQNYCLTKKDIEYWPDTFRILYYPELSQFRRYPTIASNNSVILDDINRKACSIELYLPDCLIKNENKYKPIEWESRMKIENLDGVDEYLYQGVISDKENIKRGFHSMKKEIQKNRSVFIPEQWERLKVLIDHIMFSFV